ncbi:hypothetical protein ACIGKL_14765 [Pseudomonas sp. NPDC077186]|uniref:hypothetical protein n=1 Tax=Pseudomonas sp. NPDC077186 TaxID=3364421 RepID=UPI0037C50D84
MKKSKKQKIERNPRSEWTYATSSIEVSEISLKYDPVSDTVTFLSPLENGYHEASYEREKGPKILNRIPIKGQQLTLDPNSSLENFDLIIAIDTNTNIIGEREISATGVILANWVEDPTTESKSLCYKTPFCLEFTELSEPREKIGWIMALSELLKNNHLPKAGKIGVVVDSYLSEIPAINAKAEPIYENIFLPSNMTLLYASSDVGLEYTANKLIKYADQSAKLVLEHIKSGRASINEKVISGRPFKGYRKILGKNAPNG